MYFIARTVGNLTDSRRCKILFPAFALFLIANWICYLNPGMWSWVTQLMLHQQWLPWFWYSAFGTNRWPIRSRGQFPDKQLCDRGWRGCPMRVCGIFCHGWRSEKFQLYLCSSASGWLWWRSCGKCWCLHERRGHNIIELIAAFDTGVTPFLCRITLRSMLSLRLRQPMNQLMYFTCLVTCNELRGTGE